MSTEGTGDNAQNANSGQSVVSPPATPVEPVVETGPAVVGEDGGHIDPKSYDETYVKGLRTESAKYRTERNDLKAQIDDYAAKVKEFEDAKLSADEKLQRDFEETRTQAERYRRQAEDNSLALQLALAAQKENIADVKAAVRLANRDKVEFGEDGSVTNLDDVIADLKTEFSSLFQAAPAAPNTGATNPAKAPAERKYTKEDLKKMSPDKINELFHAGKLNNLMGGN